MPTITAAVAREQGKPLTPEQLQLDDLRPGEARVRMVATGICHTDAIVRDGVYPTPPARRAGARGSRHLRSGRRGRDRGPARRSCRALGHLLRRMPGRAHGVLREPVRPGLRRQAARRVHHLVGRRRHADLLALLRPVLVRQLRQRGPDQPDPGAGVGTAGDPGAARLRGEYRRRIRPQRAAAARGLLDRRHRRGRRRTGSGDARPDHRVRPPSSPPTGTTAG